MPRDIKMSNWPRIWTVLTQTVNHHTDLKTEYHWLIFIYMCESTAWNFIFFWKPLEGTINPGNRSCGESAVSFGITNISSTRNLRFLLSDPSFCSWESSCPCAQCCIPRPPSKSINTRARSMVTGLWVSCPSDFRELFIYINNLVEIIWNIYQLFWCYKLYMMPWYLYIMQIAQVKNLCNFSMNQEMINFKDTHILLVLYL